MNVRGNAGRALRVVQDAAWAQREPGRGRHRNVVRRRWVRPVVAAVALAGVACTSSDTSNVAGEAAEDCSSVADEVADLVFDVAQVGGERFPGSLPAPVDGDGWALATEVVDGDPDMTARIEHVQQAASNCPSGFAEDAVDQRVDALFADPDTPDPTEDAEQYTILNIMVIVAEEL